MDFQHDILPLKDIIFRTALRITMNREEAEDIVQDILLKLWQQRDELADITNLDAFALTSARNLALDRKARLERKNLSLEDDLHDRVDEWQISAYDNIVNDERISFVHQMVGRLPEKQRTIFQLRDVEEKSYKEIAEILNISESDVKVNLFRARAALKEGVKHEK